LLFNFSDFQKLESSLKAELKEISEKVDKIAMTDACKPREFILHYYSEGQELVVRTKPNMLTVYVYLVVI